MGSKKTSQKQKEFSQSSFPHPVKLKPGVKLIPHTPGESLRKTDEVLQALFECLVTADFEAFKEIVIGHLEARNISKELEKNNISRRSFYNAMSENGNPTWDLITKLFKMISKENRPRRVHKRKAS